MKRLVMCACLLVVMPNLYASEAMQLLNQMSLAVHKLDYQGEVVYSQGEGFTALRIRHSVDDGVEHEAVTNLDSNGQTNSQNDVGFSVASFPKITPEMESIYSFDVGGTSEVAGRLCTEVVARPKDHLRYLHRYCIDNENHMLLNYSLVNRTHKPVEKMMFTHIKFGKFNLKDYLKDKVSKIRDKIKPFNLVKKQENKSNWSFSKLPKGFYIDSILTKEDSNGSNSMEQIILTDNVTSISLFIEPENKNGIDSSQLDYRGALNVLTVEKEEHNITIVGEVPYGTLVNVVNNLEYNPH